MPSPHLPSEGQIGRGLASLAMSLLLCAAHLHAAPLISELGQEIALGGNLNNEACRLRLTRAPGKDSDRQVYSIFCEGWTQSSGFVSNFKPRSDFSPQGLLTTSDYGKQLEIRLAECTPPSAAKIADRLSGFVRFCTRRDGGWPWVVGIVEAGGRAYNFETLPTNLPLAERAIDALSSNQGVVVKQAPRSALIQQYETTVGGSAAQFGVADIGAVSTLTRLGIEEEWAARHPEAERAWGKALETMERIFGPQHPENGRAMSNKALAVYRQRRAGEALELLKRAEPLTQRSRRLDDYPELLTYRSYVEDRLGHLDEALAAAQKSVEIRRAQAHELAGRASGTRLAAGSLQALGHGALGVARAELPLNHFKEAVAAAEESAQSFAQGYGDPHPMTGWALVEAAFGYLGLHDLPHAREAAEKALAMHAELYGDGDAVFQDAVLAGRIAVEEKRNAEALGHFRRAIRSAGKSTAIEVRPSLWLAGYVDLLSAGGGGAGDAFLAAQLAHGGVTDDAIRAMATRAAADEPEIAAVVRALQDAQGKLVGFRTRLAEEERKPPEERDPQLEERIKSEGRDAEAAAAAAEQRLQAQFPRYARLVRPSQVPADALGRLLHPDEALLLALPTPASTFLFLVRGGRVVMRKSEVKSADLAAQISALRQTLDTGDSGIRAFDLAAARRLYDTILAPIEKDLAGTRHLVFVSSGPLLSLPLGILVRPGGSEAAPPYLARDMAISVVPSVSAFAELRQGKAAAAAAKPFLGFGDPDFTGRAGELRGLADLAKLCRADKAIEVLQIHALPRLPDTAIELRQIAAALKAAPDSVVLGGAATKEALKARNLAQYRVLAFATHGLLANELDCQNEPALVLSLPPKAQRGQESLLAASDIAGLKLNADWVLLSACNTAGPEGLAGEALSGLTRAFFYAGARSVMATHWPVASEPTVRLTTLTFESYAKDPKRGKAAALHEAQLALMNDPTTAHPVFWAPFVLVGDGG